KGINVLYLAVGFLEWYEDEFSETCHHAPLLLLALNMSRRSEQGRIGFELTGEGADIEVNTTLVEFLQKDYHIALPPFVANGDNGESATRGPDETPSASSGEDGDTVEAWLGEVAEIIKPRARWLVRRFVTIGIFPFSRISLYKDLESSRWRDEHLV